MKIKVGTLLAYDYYLIKISLPLIYQYADKIVYSLDANRVSYTGNKFYFDESILEWIKEYDIDNKIHIYQDNFYIASNSAMQNETRQRNLMAEYMGLDGWHIQLDSDEYFIDFGKFVSYLNSLSTTYSNRDYPISVSVFWLLLFKSDMNGFFYISENKAPISIASNNPVYKRARNTDSRNIVTDFVIVHQTWDRVESEIINKLKNWSHSDEINVDECLKLWKDLSISNFHNFKFEGPFKNPGVWGPLKYIEAKDINELIFIYNETKFFTPSNYVIFTKNLVQSALKAPYLLDLYNMYLKFYNKIKFGYSFKKP